MLKRLPWILLFGLFASAVLVGAHVYLARRLVLDPGIPEPWRLLLLGGIAAGGLCLVLEPFAQRLLSAPRARWVGWPASLWMGAAFLLLVFLGASDAALWIAGRTARAASEGLVDAPSTAGVRSALVAGLAGLAAAAALRSGLSPPRLRRVALRLQRWPRALDGFRVVQISDVHLGPILDRRFAAELVRRVNALEPDLVAITGDLVDGPVRWLRGEVAPLAGLRAKRGVFFVTGNHDHYSGAADWVDAVRDLGIRVLRNERVPVEGNGAGFDLVGVDDHRGSLLGGDGGEDLDAALGGRDPARPALLLAHDPTTFKRAQSMGIDLQISGHTHGGQIWPFSALVRLAVPYVAGRYEGRASGNGGHRAQLYVSRGTGFWGPPMRLFAPAEITEIALHAAEEQEAPERAGISAPSPAADPRRGSR